VFDPFFTTKAVGKGLGLGLSISYGIVRDFDGEIRASNREEGGTEMIIELPSYQPQNVSIHA
jgi:two-component system C4-dicarboxylate transport sensor histidine kinase DctB